MKRKNIIISAIALMFSLCLFAFGVYSASNPTVGISGQVSFTLSNANVLIRGKVNGQSQGLASTVPQELVSFPGIDETDYSQSTKVPAVEGNVSQTYLDYTTPQTDYNSYSNGIAIWNLGALYFYQKED